MSLVWRAAALSVAGAAASACAGGSTFACVQDGQCGVAGSVCQSDGWCSFVDDTCPSGFRYGEHAGDGLGGTCVPEPGAGTETPTTAGSGGDATMPVLDEGDGDGSTLALTGSLDEADGTGTASTSTGEPQGSSDAGDDPTGDTGDPGDALVLWLPFDDLGDPFADASGNGLDAWCSGSQCPTLESTPSGGVLVLDGIEGHLHVDHHPLLELYDDFSVAVWVRVDVSIPRQFHTIVSKPLGPEFFNSWELGVPGSMDLLVSEGSLLDVAVAEVPLRATGVWHHLAFTMGDGDLLLYLDGSEVASTDSVAIAYDDHPLMIGADIDFEEDANFLTGRIDDVRVYARVLSPSELAELASDPP